MKHFDFELLDNESVLHEYTHAYSHVGKDIDMNYWESEHFAKTSLYISTIIRVGSCNALIESITSSENNNPEDFADCITSTC